MIRSVTLGIPLGERAPEPLRAEVARFFRRAEEHLNQAGMPARTWRLTLPPLRADPRGTRASIASQLGFVSRMADETGVRWFCQPVDFLSPGGREERLAALLEAIPRFPRMFVNFMVADEGTLVPEAIHDYARFVLDVSRKSHNGFDNFRVGASCACPPGTPFFPFSRHEGPDLAFSLALETTSLALEEMEGAPRASLSELRTRLVERFAVALAGVDRLGRLLEENSGVRFLGIDASFAPLPHGGPSVARLVEALAGGPVGCPGTLFATAFLTDLLRAALDMSEARTVGFNGVMYSVLEDDALAAASHKRTLTLEGLMACAALCGCGLDMVPLPGGIFSEELAGLTMDVAALALRLSKPLGVRLLPIPGRVVNERTSFNLDFLCDARILAVPHRDHAGPGEEAPFRYLTPPSQRAPAARTPS